MGAITNDYDAGAAILCDGDADAAILCDGDADAAIFCEIFFAGLGEGSHGPSDLAEKSLEITG